MSDELIIDESKIFAPAFYSVWNDFLDEKYTEFVLKGGRGSAKSSFAAAAILLGLEMYPEANAICYRKVAATQLDSCYSQFEFTLQGSLSPLADHWKCSKSPLKIVNTNTGQQILFRGLDDPSKSKSLRAPKGYFRFLWFEETAEFDGMEEIRSVMQSVLRGGQSFQTFYTYNPPMTSANWCNSEFSKPQPGRLIHHSDYRSVSPDWLGKNFFVMAENLRLQNERAYRHEYLGEVTGTGGAIFPNVVPIQLTDEEIATFSNLRWGLDLGFALDPTALVGIEMRKAEREIIIFDEVYKTHLLTHQIADEIKNHHFGYQYVMCDSAAPLTIADLESQGCPVLGAAKGPDSIKHGILYLQSLNHIYIDVLRCPNTYKEFSMYEYEKNKAGQFLSKYPDTNNHAIDATRYGLEEDSAGMGLM